MAATSSAANLVKKPKDKAKSQEEIVSGFQELRKQQRTIAAKISEIEMDLKEYDLVIETLEEVEADRTCYRMIGGVLVERTVNDVLPSLSKNKQQMKTMVESLQKQLEAKGVEINQYRDQHNLKIHSEDTTDTSQSDAGTESTSKQAMSGVLVS